MHNDTGLAELPADKTEELSIGVLEACRKVNGSTAAGKSATAKALTELSFVQRKQGFFASEEVLFLFFN